jgi:hypothetical protein
MTAMLAVLICGEESDVMTILQNSTNQPISFHNTGIFDDGEVSNIKTLIPTLVRIGQLVYTVVLSVAER